jgi:hypothetical protein
MSCERKKNGSLTLPFLFYLTVSKAFPRPGFQRESCDAQQFFLASAARSLDGMP